MESPAAVEDVQRPDSSKEYALDGEEEGEGGKELTEDAAAALQVEVEPPQAPEDNVSSLIITACIIMQGLGEENYITAIVWQEGVATPD